MKNKSMSEERWATFGKVSAVIVLVCTIVGTIVAVYTMAARKAALETTVSASVFRVPPELKAEKAEEQLASWLNRNRFDGYFVVTISNKGGVQADNVVLDFPYYGVAEVWSEDEPTVQREFQDSITLGTIRPNKSKTVYAWTREKSASYKEKDIGVTHTKGIGRIVFVRETAGFWNAIYQHMPGWLWPLFFALGFLPWLIQSALRSSQISEMEKRVNELESEKGKSSRARRKDTNS